MTRSRGVAVVIVALLVLVPATATGGTTMPHGSTRVRTSEGFWGSVCSVLRSVKEAKLFDWAHVIVESLDREERGAAVLKAGWLLAAENPLLCGKSDRVERNFYLARRFVQEAIAQAPASAAQANRFAGFLKQLPSVLITLQKSPLLRVAKLPAPRVTLARSPAELQRMGGLRPGDDIPVDVSWLPIGRIRTFDLEEVSGTQTRVISGVTPVWDLFGTPHVQLEIASGKPWSVCIRPTIATGHFSTPQERTYNCSSPFVLTAGVPIKNDLNTGLAAGRNECRPFRGFQLAVTGSTLPHPANFHVTHDPRTDFSVPVFFTNGFGIVWSVGFPESLHWICAKRGPLGSPGRVLAVYWISAAAHL